MECFTQGFVSNGTQLLLSFHFAWKAMRAGKILCICQKNANFTSIGKDAAKRLLQDKLNSHFIEALVDSVKSDSRHLHKLMGDEHLHKAQIRPYTCNTCFSLGFCCVRINRGCFWWKKVQDCWKKCRKTNREKPTVTGNEQSSTVQKNLPKISQFSGDFFTHFSFIVWSQITF